MFSVPKWSGPVAALALSALLAGSLGCTTQVDVVVDEAPPVVKVEQRPAAPTPQHVWKSGHWARRGHKWVWTAGNWHKPRPGQRWVDGHWERRGGRWHWIEGHWSK